MPLILPLTKGHLSNVDRIIWRKGVPIRGGLLYTSTSTDTHVPIVCHGYRSVEGSLVYAHILSDSVHVLKPTLTT